MACNSTKKSDWFKTSNRSEGFIKINTFKLKVSFFSFSNFLCCFFKSFFSFSKASQFWTIFFYHCVLEVTCVDCIVQHLKPKFCLSFPIVCMIGFTLSELFLCQFFLKIFSFPFFFTHKWSNKPFIECVLLPCLDHQLLRLNWHLRNWFYICFLFLRLNKQLRNWFCIWCT